MRVIVGVQANAHFLVVVEFLPLPNAVHLHKVRVLVGLNESSAPAKEVHAREHSAWQYLLADIVPVRHTMRIYLVIFLLLILFIRIVAESLFTVLILSSFLQHFVDLRLVNEHLNTLIQGCR